MSYAHVYDPATDRWVPMTAAMLGGGGGGGGGDASAANQATQITAANALNTAFGAQADAQATDDNSAFTFLARIKRVSQGIWDVRQRLPVTLGAKTATASLSVTQDTDTTWRTRAFQPTSGTGGALALTAGTSSAAQAVAAGTVIRFGNSGGAPIPIEFGNSSVVATANSAIEILPGTSEAIMVPVGATHYAAFCASTATLKWVTGTGS